MNKLSKTASIALVAFAVAGPAAAANLPLPAPPSPSPPPPSWTFFYIGGNAGVGWSTESAATSVPGAPNTLITVPFLGSATWGTGLSGISGGGGNGGGQIGFNWQMSNLVLGFEADLQAHGGAIATNSSFVAPVPGVFGAGIVTNQFNSKTPWFGTLRGRLGTTATTYGPSLLIYGTGGLAYGKENVSDLMTVNFPGGPLSEAFPFSTSATKWGYAVGGGFELMLAGTHWLVRAEYLYVDLKANGSQTVATSVLGPSALATDIMRFTPGRDQMNIFRVGLDYHW